MWTVYDYCDLPAEPGEQPRNRIVQWLETVPVAQRARLDVKLHTIETDRENERGSILPPNGVSGPLRGKYRNLYEIKVSGTVKGPNLRLLVCRGPFDSRTEITLLFGARELDKKWVPRDAPDRALERFGLLSANRQRRTLHVQVS